VFITINFVKILTLLTKFLTSHFRNLFIAIWKIISLLAAADLFSYNVTPFNVFS